MKIGLTQRVEVVPDTEERRDCLDQSWAQLLLQAGFTPVPLPNQPQYAEDLLDKLELGGVILTGGNDLAVLRGAKNVAPERDEFEHLLLESAMTRSLPVLGVCRGLQMIVHTCGGHLLPVEDHVRRSHPIIPRQSPMPTLPRAEVNSYHHFGTRPELLPTQLKVAGVASDGSVEAVVHATLPIWGLMWHPERPSHVGGARDERDVALLHALFGNGQS